MKKHVLGLLVLLSLLASFAVASPMLIGGSGGLLLPDTDTAQGIQLGLGKQLSNRGYGYGAGYEASASVSGTGLRWPATQLTLGVLPNLEVGYMWADGGGDVHPFQVSTTVNGGGVTAFFNAKYAFAVAGFDMAVGGQLGDDAAGVVYYDDVKVFYLAASKAFANGLKGTLSLNHIKPDYSAAVLIPGLTLEKTLAGGTKIGVEALVGQKYNDFLFSNFAGSRFGNVFIEMPLDKQLSVKAGILGIGDPAANNQTWLSASYAFGKNLVE